MATDPSQATNPIFAAPAPNSANQPIFPGGTIGPSDIGNPALTPSMPALPVTSSSSSSGGNGPTIDTENLHKFYVISASIREAYDSNVNTGTQATSSEETSLSGSIGVSFPMEDTTISASLTSQGTYYSQKGATSQSGATNTFQYSNSFTAAVEHDFSTRANLTLSDSLVDSPEPNLFGTTGTPYRDGENISNAFSLGSSIQLTPLLGTQTTYGNTIVRYLDEPDVAAAQDSMENTGSETVSLAYWKTISLDFGGIIDVTTYDTAARGYSSYTGFIGTQWQAKPNLALNLRAGGSLTSTVSAANPTALSPYVDLSMSWQLGERSSLGADYSHEVTPTDQAAANAQQADRVSGNFAYQVTPQITTHLELSATYSDIPQSLVVNSEIQGYTETDYAVNVGASYNFIKYLSLTLDITESGISSEISNRDYSRSEVAVGVRGTY